MRGKPRLIQRNDSPFWFIYVPQKGERRAQRFSTGTGDYQQAEAIFGQWLIERRKPEPNDETLINDMLARYVEYKKDDATVQYHMRHLEPFFKGYHVSQISNQLIRDYAQERLLKKVTQGKRCGIKTVSPATVRRELDTLSATLGFAKREGYIKEAPYIEKPQASPPRQRWLTHDEQARLRAECITPHLLAFVEIGLNTGARPSSILELKWFQVDLEERLIHFNPEERIQTKKTRPTVKINSALFPLLESMRENATSEFVIARKNGEKIASIKKGFRDACKRAGIQGATPYTLRHTAITMMIRGGVSLAQAGQVAGHSEPRTTSRYAKHDPSFTHDAVEVLATGALVAHKRAKKSRKSKKPANNHKVKQWG